MTAYSKEQCNEESEGEEGDYCNQEKCSHHEICKCLKEETEKNFLF